MESDIRLGIQSEETYTCESLDCHQLWAKCDAAVPGFKDEDDAVEAMRPLVASINGFRLYGVHLSLTGGLSISETIQSIAANVDGVSR